MCDPSDRKRVLSADELADLFGQEGVRPTALRELIYTTIARSDEALSLGDIEIRLSTVDKSTISRTLHLLETVGVIHHINDGSGAVKYAVSQIDTDEPHNAPHAHFYCIRCGKTVCIDHILPPPIELPKGYTAQAFNMIVRGICPSCNGIAPVE
ncbi:Fur family transcriptional regulator [Porphyromonas sp.]|uniref:Fur family transcriptional regulator n=1 Tax=Porphyromonas sp. TaxID=1924944 RepID=UPI0026DC9063|nr:transcriptional repressor [Porphyromonas sp.]MDO4770612.1 transcriptional repressor [Porphyromonas sp.]